MMRRLPSRVGVDRLIRSLPASERGITLTEIVVVMVLASLVMVGLVSFYLSSQATWIDASTQAISQREATFTLEAVSNAARSAVSANVMPSPDAAHVELQLGLPDGTQQRFWWQDSTVFHEDSTGTRPLVVASKVDTFEIDTNDTLVFIRNLVVRSPNQQRVRLTSLVLLYNR
jgi:Tfp pilus assembly protein PilW